MTAFKRNHGRDFFVRPAFLLQGSQSFRAVTVRQVAMMSDILLQLFPWRGCHLIQNARSKASLFLSICRICLGFLLLKTNMPRIKNIDVLFLDPMGDILSVFKIRQNLGRVACDKIRPVKASRYL